MVKILKILLLISRLYKVKLISYCKEQQVFNICDISKTEWDILLLKNVPQRKKFIYLLHCFGVFVFLFWGSSFSCFGRLCFRVFGIFVFVSSFSCFGGLRFRVLGSSIVVFGVFVLVVLGLRFRGFGVFDRRFRGLRFRGFGVFDRRFRSLRFGGFGSSFSWFWGLRSSFSGSSFSWFWGLRSSFSGSSFSLGTVHFLWDGGRRGTGGILGSVIWKLHDPLKLANFTQMTPPQKGFFWMTPPPHPHSFLRKKLHLVLLYCKTFEYLWKERCIKEKKIKRINRRKSKDRKHKRFENNVHCVCHICVANPLTNELPHCRVNPSRLTLIPEACINVEYVATLLF